MNDLRYNIFKQRLNLLSIEEIERIVTHIDIVCFDTYNYNMDENTFCPLAVAMNLHETMKVKIFTDENVGWEIAKRFNPVNVLKGVKGNFYTTNRRDDLLNLCEEVIKEKSK